MTKRKTNSKLLKEAIVDANALKELAIENAKEYLSEVFSPRIKSVLKAKLQREDELPDETDNDDEEDAEVAEDEEPVVEPDTDEDEDEVTAEQDEPADDDFDTDEDEEEVTSEQDEEPVLPDSTDDEEDIDLEQVLNDLDADEDIDEDSEIGEDEDIEDVEDEEPVGEDEDVTVDDTSDDEEIDIDIEDDEETPVGEDEDLALDNDDEEDIEEPVEEDEDVAIEDIPDDEDEEKIEKMSTEIRKLRKENKEYRNILRKLSHRLNEVNLLNAKLLYAQKLTRHPRITDKQKATVISALDRARNLREVKLTFANLVEAFEVQNERSKKLSRINEILDGGASSRKVGNPTHIISESAIKRIQKLAGIRKE